jgi:putative inorganic carbon (HCO3(-)) transporter
MSALAYRLRRSTLQITSFAMVLMLGLLFGVAIPALANQSLYRLIMIALAGISLLGLLMSKHPRRVLMFFLMFAIPLNLAFTPLGHVPDHAGGALPGFVIYLYDLPLIGLLVIWLIDITLHRARIIVSAVDVVAVLFILWNSLSLYNSSNVSLSLYEIARLVKLYLLARIIGSLVDSPGAVRAVLFGLITALLLQSGVTVLQYFFNYNLGGLGFIVGDEAARRVSGTVGWPNTLGAYIAAVLCWPLTLWLCNVGGRRRWMLLALCVVGALPLVLTFSRGAWLGLGAGLIVAIALGLYGGLLTIKGISKLLVVGLIAALMIMLFSDQIAARIGEDTITVRGNLNAIAWNMIEANPVLGIGVNTFVNVMTKYDQSGVTSYFAEPVHNAFLLIAAETGLIGLGLFLTLNALVFRIGAQAVLRSERFLSVSVIGLLAGLTAILVSNLGDVHLKTDAIFSLFWLFIGLILAIRRMMPTSQVNVPVHASLEAAP